MEINVLLDSIPIMIEDRWKFKPESLTPLATPLEPSTVVPPKLDFKSLLDTLKYVFLGPSETIHVIIVSNLNHSEEELLIKVLWDHKEATGWTIADIKEISPSVVQHRIHLEENAKTS